MLDFWLLIFYIISIQHSPLSPFAEKADFELDPHLARGGFSTFGVKDLRGCVRVKGYLSDSVGISACSPQDCVLFPLLFILYTSDWQFVPMTTSPIAG